jgi:hypothetical protein
MFAFVRSCYTFDQNYEILTSIFIDFIYLIICHLRILAHNMNMVRQNSKITRVMKNARIIISIALVALATTSFAQPSNLKDKLFHNKTDIHPVVYTSETAGLRDWKSDLQDRLDHGHLRISGSPSVDRTFFFSQVEVIYENESGLEDWMSKPFESTTYQEDLSIEPWMAKPFYSLTERDDLKLESWMAVPFECGTPEEKWIVADNRE